MNKVAYKDWVNRYLNEDTDWEVAMCKAESEVTAKFFGRIEKRKAKDDVFAMPVKKKELKVIFSIIQLRR